MITVYQQRMQQMIHCTTNTASKTQRHLQLLYNALRSKQNTGKKGTVLANESVEVISMQLSILVRWLISRQHLGSQTRETLVHYVFKTDSQLTTQLQTAHENRRNITWRLTSKKNTFFLFTKNGGRNNMQCATCWAEAPIKSWTTALRLWMIKRG